MSAPKVIEHFREIKTKVITLDNPNRRRQSIEPIRTQSKYISVTSAKRGKTRAGNTNWFCF